MRRGLFFCSSLVVLLVGGCALFTDLTGYSDPPKKAGSDSGVDPGRGDGGLNPFAPGNDGGGNNNNNNGNDTGAPCTPAVTLDETFASGFGEFTPLSPALDRGYPKMGAWESSPAALLLPLALEDDQTYEMFTGLWAGIWRFKEVPLVAFDMEVEAFIGCPLEDCGDGFAIQWTTMQTMEAVNANAVYGGGLGLALHTNGGAVAADLHPNEELGDPLDKSLEVIELNASQNEPYKWVVSSTPQSTERAWHKYKVSMRNGVVAVDYDDKVGFVTGNVTPIDKGMIGFSTGTGGLINGVAIKNFKGRFYSCTP